MSEQRLTTRLIGYWNLLRKEAPLPDFGQFNASAIEDIWQQCVLFMVQPAAEGQQPKISFFSVGEKVRGLYGADMVGRAVAAGQKHFQGAAAMRKIQQVLTSPEPVCDEGQYANERGKVVKYRTCLLPFGNREGKVTHVVAGFSWREF